MSNPVQNTIHRSTFDFLSSSNPIFIDFGGQDITRDAMSSIFSRVGIPKDLASFALGSRGLYQLYLHSFKWKSFVQKYFPDSYKEWQCDLHPGLLSGPQGRDFYMQLTSTRNNIKTGKYRLREMQDDYGWVEGFCAHGNDLYLEGSSGTLKVFDLEKGKELRIIDVPGYSIDKFCIDKEVLYVSLEDEGKIIAFDLKSGKEMGLSFQWNMDEAVSKLCADKNYLCATFKDGGSDEGYEHITVWNLESRKGNHLFRSDGEEVGVDDFCVYEDNLYAGYCDGLIEVFALENGKQVHTLQNCQEETDPSIFYLRVDNGYLHSCSQSGTFKIWDLKSGNELQKIQLPKDFDHCHITCLYEHDHFIYFGCSDTRDTRGLTNNGTEKIRDLNVYDLIGGQTYKIPCFLEPAAFSSHNFHNLYMYKDRLFVCAYQSSLIKIMNFNFPPSHNDFQQTLENNLNILEKMKKAGDFKTVEALAKTLHPKFKNRLRQHCFKTRLWSMAPIPLDAISRVYTEMNIESLLSAVHYEDGKRISQILDDLQSNDPSCVVMLCHSLEKMIYSEAVSEKEIALQNREIWDLASRVQKEKAVNECKQILKQRWGEDLPLLLADLGIVHPHEYSRKLGCPFDHLSKIGIFTTEDLKVLGISCPPLDREYEVAKLRSYVDQSGILPAWETNYYPQRIYTLTELAARPDLVPNDFYQMGI
jgi:WD40 repeat protein